MNLPVRGSEEYYCERDEFVRYIAINVNPERVKNNLKPIDEDGARECFRIIYDFREHIENNPVKS